jgi:hypothetical protein
LIRIWGTTQTGCTIFQVHYFKSNHCLAYDEDIHGSSSVEDDRESPVFGETYYDQYPRETSPTIDTVCIVFVIS